ncbi:MAG: serine acetyltransferase [Candidatus Symbiothrix sp.]|jgi:serine acetyltransferase|nr:serine acetyltransferase [Candidatus Symbiothrix sp.]
MTYKQILWEVKRNPEKRFRYLIYLMRVSALLTHKESVLTRFTGHIIGSFYAFFSGWLLNIDLSYNTEIGEGLVIYHGMGLVINPSAIIGKNATLRQNTTIGNASFNGEAPVIGNNVDVGSNSIIIGDITVGDNCVIGAGSVVTKNVPDNCTVVGNPAYIIKKEGKACKEKL